MQRPTTSASRRASRTGGGAVTLTAAMRRLAPVVKALAHDPRAWLVLLGFSLRLVWVLAVPSRPVGDFALYREAAEHLLDQGRLDDEFVYMPGYVMLLAAVRALGGQLLAMKMVGVVAGTAVVFSAGGIAQSLFGRRAGLIATALAAVWPAGIAAASVTGTDMPAGALGALAVHALVSRSQGRDAPWRAAVLSGLVFGLAAWVRAVAAPLAALSLLYWLARGVRWPMAMARTAATVAIAFLVLLPWGLRNQRVYGELFFTDSHGGHTALVGANPNSEGTYSRSLNLMFTKGTGYRLFAPPARHRQSDRVAYQVAKTWSAFEPAYALGLVVAKADRLLTHERNLLYWPVFRQGVLDDAHRAFFAAHRAALELAADLFWWMVVALSAAGVALCTRDRSSSRPESPSWSWPALAILVFPGALMAIYTVFFAEVRYHLAIVPLLLPYAAHALDWVWVAANARQDRGRRQQAAAATRPPEWRRPALYAGAAVLALFAGWPALLAAGERVRARHRWAATVCAYPQPGETHLCLWRRGAPAAGSSAASTDSPVRGSWDGVGIRVNASSAQGQAPAGADSGGGVLASARTEVPVGPGRFRVSASVLLSADAASAPGLAVALRANGRVIARTVVPSAKAPMRGEDGVFGAKNLVVSAPPLIGVVELTNAPFLLEIEVESTAIGSTAEATVWVSQLLVERF